MSQHNNKGSQSAHIPTKIQHCATLNTDKIDPRFRELMWESAWSADTTYPVVYETWQDINAKERACPALGQCKVTHELLQYFYPGSATAFLYVHDPVIDVNVPHYFFWPDAYTYYDTGSVNAARQALHDMSDRIVTGDIKLNNSPFVDITGDQFNKGSHIIFVDPLSDEYPATVLEHHSVDQSFAWRTTLLAQRFNQALQAKYGIDALQLKREITGNAYAGFISDMADDAVRKVLEGPSRP